MAQPHLSSKAIAIVLAVVAGLFYAASVLYGAWIDGRRQKIRNKGKHPVTDATGVHAREDEKQEQKNGSQRSH